MNSRILISLVLLAPAAAFAQVAARSGRQTIGTDLSTLSVTPSGTSTPMSMANATMPSVVNVKRPPYSAKGDGVADDTAALNSAVTAAGTVTEVLLPCPGTYSTTNRGTLACGLYFMPAGTGAVLRPVSGKFGDVVSVNDFGVGDSTAVLHLLPNGRVAELPYLEPYAWFRMDQVLPGAQAASTLVGEKQEPTTFTRATTGTVVVGGVESTAASGQYRFQDNPPGLLIEPTRQNYISTPDAPVSQAALNLSLTGTRAYYLRVEGTGSLAIALSAGSTGTATGLPCTATASSPCSFVMTAPGTVDTTVAGTLTFAQLEQGGGAAPQGIAPTSRIHTAATRNADQVAIAGVLRNGHDWLVSIRAQPNGGLSWKGNDDRGLFAIGDTAAAANTARAWVAGSDGFMRFEVYDNAAVVKQLNVPSVFLGNIEHDFWFYNTADGAKIEAWVDGVMVAPTSITGTGAGFITTMPANFRPGSQLFSYLNGVVKEAKIYYDTTPERLPQPTWTKTITPNTVACIGDSITFGTGTPTPYPTTLQANLSAGTTGAWTVLNAGVGGDITWQTVRRWGAGVRRQSQQYVVMLSGTNDLANGQTSSTAWNNLMKIAGQVRADGKTLVMLTILPRTTLTTAMNADRVTLNTRIRNYCVAANQCILADTDPQFDNGDGHTLKVAYDSGDGIHPNLAGANLLASIVAGVIPH